MRSPNISSKTIFEYFWNFFIFDQKKVKLKIKKIYFFQKFKKKWRQSIFSVETHSRDGFRKTLMTKADKLLILRKGQNTIFGSLPKLEKSGKMVLKKKPSKIGNYKLPVFYPFRASCKKSEKNSAEIFENRPVSPEFWNYFLYYCSIKYSEI